MNKQVEKLNEFNVGDKVLIKYKGIAMEDTIMHISKYYIGGEKYDLTPFYNSGRLIKK